VREPDCLGAVCLDTGAATLFVPRLPPAYAVVMGRIKSTEEWRALYGVERVVAPPAPAGRGAAAAHAAGGADGERAVPVPRYYSMYRCRDVQDPWAAAGGRPEAAGAAPTAG
jgi:hypothetical protein